MNQQVVIISGMHRSGTSLTASIIQKAGVNIGNHLFGSDKGNLSGHFEDVDFNTFHDKVLKRFGQTFLVQNSNHLKEDLTSEETDQALALIAQRSDNEMWGWKDPRTSLFLNFWHNLLPQARYIFVYRHPLEVTFSLLRRGKDFDIEALANPFIGLQAWQVYNRAILEFYQQHPDICLLVHVSAIINDTGAFIDASVQKLALSLQNNDVSDLYHPAEFKQLDFPAEIPTLLEQLAPSVLPLYYHLETIADLPAPTASQPPPVSSSQLVKLRQLVDGLMGYELLDQDQRAYLFALLLASLAPETVLAGKHSLDQFRTNKISQLEIRLASQDQQLVAKETQLDHLRQQFTAKETQHYNLQQRLVETTTQINYLQQQLATQKNHLAHLRQQLTEQQAQASQLGQQLNTIKDTKAWRLIELWYRLKEKVHGLMPASSSQADAPLPDIPADRPAFVESIFTNEVRREPTSRPAILFISHYAGRTGAPILLLNFLKWFKANTDIPFEILLKGDGQLRPEFETLGQVMIWPPNPPPQTKSTHLAHLREHLRQANIGLIYSNTITNGEVLADLAILNCPVITHVHELEFWINYRAGTQNLNQVKKYTNHYIAVSQAVKQNLVRNLCIPEANIDVVYGFIPTQLDPINQTTLRHLREQLKIPQEAWVVGASGTTDWRKGPDLFIQLARTIQQRYLEQPVHFIWVGGKKEGPDFETLWHDIKHAGLEAHIHFVGTHPNPLDYFALFDVFTLVSREDPFPLVNLELALLGKPIVCFDGAGGAKEFVQDDCGFVVPYLDIGAMADKVIELLNSPELRQQLGQKAAKKVRDRHDTTIQAPQLLSVIQQFLQNRQGSVESMEPVKTNNLPSG